MHHVQKCYCCTTIFPRLESNPTPGWHKTIRKTHVGPRFTGLLARVPYYMSKVVLLMKSENQMHYWFSLFPSNNNVKNPMFTRQILFRLRWVWTEEVFLPQRLMNDAFQESVLKVSVSSEIVYVIILINPLLGFLRSCPSTIYRSV